MAVSAPPAIPASSPTPQTTPSPLSSQMSSEGAWSQALNDAGGQASAPPGAQGSSAAQPEEAPGSVEGQKTSGTDQQQTEVQAATSSPAGADSTAVAGPGSHPAQKKHTHGASDTSVNQVAAMVLGMGAPQAVSRLQSASMPADGGPRKVNDLARKASVAEPAPHTSSSPAHKPDRGNQAVSKSEQLEGSSSTPQTEAELDNRLQVEAEAQKGSSKPKTASQSDESLNAAPGGDAASSQSAGNLQAASSPAPGNSNLSTGAMASTVTSPSVQAKTETVSAPPSGVQPLPSHTTQAIAGSSAEMDVAGSEAIVKSTNGGGFTPASLTGNVISHASEAAPGASGVSSADAAASLANANQGSLSPMALAAVVSAMHQTGQSTTVIRLDPPDLGSLTVHLTMQAGQVNVLFTPSSALTGQLLHSNLDALRQSMASAGLNLGQADVGQGNAGNSGGGQQEGRNSSGTGRGNYTTAEYGVSDGLNSNGAIAYA